MKLSVIVLAVSLFVGGCRASSSSTTTHAQQELPSSWRRVQAEAQARCAGLGSSMDTFSEKSHRIRRVIDALPASDIERLVGEDDVSDESGGFAYRMSTPHDYLELCRCAVLNRLIDERNAKLVVEYLAKRWWDGNEVYIASRSPAGVETFLQAFDRTSSMKIKARIAETLEDAGAIRNPGESDREVVVRYVEYWKANRDALIVNTSYQRVFGGSELLVYPNRTTH